MAGLAGGWLGLLSFAISLPLSHSPQQGIQTSFYGICLIKGRYGLYLRANVLTLSTPPNVTVLGDRVFKEVMNVTLGPLSGP